MAKITIIRGDTRTITATFTDSSNVALNLTGGEVFFTANASDAPVDDTSAIIQKDISSFAAPTTGVATITLSATDTNVTPGTYFYDCQFVSPGGVVTSLAKDKLIIKGDITRRTT